MNLKEKYKNDPEYRERRKKYARDYQHKNKAKVAAAKKAYFATEKGKAALKRAYARQRLKQSCIARSLSPGDTLGDSSKPMPESIAFSPEQPSGEPPTIQDESP